MDTLTHALVGTAISDCWFRRRLGKWATPFALAMGALPDADVVTFLVSSEYAWTHHRGYTHSFLPQLIAAPLLGWLGWRLAKRQGEWWQWGLLAFLCLCMHTIFDLITSWGTMPFLPFSNARISWDIAPILDVFISSVTAASFAANRLLRWERTDYFINPLAFPVVHKHPKRQRVADWFGKVAVGLLVAYLLLGWQQNRQTVRIARETLLQQGVPVAEVRAMPILLTYIAWEIAARDADGNVHNAVYSSYARGPMRFEEFASVPRSELAGVLATPSGGMFNWYTQGMFVGEREKGDAGTRIKLNDRRFFNLSNPGESRFTMEFREEEAGRVEEIGIVRGAGRPNLDIKDELRRLWDLTWSGRDMGPERGNAVDTAR